MMSAASAYILVVVALLWQQVTVGCAGQLTIKYTLSTPAQCDATMLEN